ncbi:MAG: DUF3179 domain-containing protein [Paracoccaceae bacterium]|nr:DUF3179 domain-containing protein [Paracoccaceae bacterium]
MHVKHALFAAGLSLAATTSQADPTFWRLEWPNTDFETTTVDNWTEILSGGPPKDGIPAIDGPQFLTVSDETGLKGPEPVVTVELDGQRPRAYPVRYLMWHEIVNDRIGEIPVSVTYCPLCNSFMVFDGRVDGRTLTFGVSGKLRNSDMVMYDRQTESWWQQAIGTGIVGELTGTELTLLPTWMESWAEYTVRNPDGLVMAQPAFPRNYGRNPYLGYDSAKRPFLYNGEQPPHGIPPLMRVVRVGDKAWTLDRLRAESEITEAGVTITWAAGQASALDQAAIHEGRDVGTVRVRDSAGNNVAHDVMFAFAFHAFWPEGTWMLGG